MTVRVLLFAGLAEQVGRHEVSLELGAGATVNTALEVLGQHHPPLAAARSRLAVAVNMAYADGRRVLADGDQLALLPPVSGG